MPLVLIFYYDAFNESYFLWMICLLLQQQLRNVIEFILQANKDPDDEVSLEACEFWYA